MTLSIFLLLMIGITTSAETKNDPSGDVFHWWQTAGSFTWEYDSSKTDIDITGYSYELTGNILTLSMTVDGIINGGELYSYSITFTNDVTGESYMVAYVSGVASTYYITQTGGGTGTAEVTGNTLSGDFDTTITDLSGFEFLGIAHQYTVLNDVTAEYWVDSTEDISDDGEQEEDTGDSGSEESDDTGTADTENNETSNQPKSSTPGFEAAIFIGAIFSIILLIKRRT